MQHQKPSKRAKVDNDTGETDAEINEEEEVWNAYRCHSVPFGAHHPAMVVESATLAAVQLPINTYPIQDSLARQIDSAALSQVQLEAVRFCLKRPNSPLLPLDSLWDFRS